jgi:type I restriction enzyme, S subunit
MAEWKEITVSDIVEKVNTGLDAIQRAPIVSYNSGIKCLRIQDISQNKSYDEWGFCEVTDDNYKRFQLKKGDIIIARTGATIGVNLLVQKDLKSVYNNGIIRIIVDRQKTFPEYLYYNFRTINYRNYIESISGGTSTQPNMQINALLDYEMKLPPIPEQIAIISVLSSLDDKVDLLHRQNKTLEQLAESP